MIGLDTRPMNLIDDTLFGADRPRVVLIGSPHDRFSASDNGLTNALGATIRIRHVSADSPLRHSVAAFRAASAAIRDRRFEMVHLLDARFALTGMMLQRHFGVPVTASVGPDDLSAVAPWSRLSMRALTHLDEVFVSSRITAASLRLRTPSLPVSFVRSAASPLPWPPKSSVARVTRALRGIRPGRLVVAVPWPENRADLRWFRDVVVPQIDSHALCLLIGVPSRRQARLIVGLSGYQSDFRVLSGRLDIAMIAAVARCVDAFVVPTSSPRSVDVESALSIALSLGGVPVVTNGTEAAGVLAHERNAFVVDPGDERGFVHTLNQVLSLPAVQRHFLGEEFARFTLSRWPWSDVADVYAERFAAHVGRPFIPADLRAA